MIWEVPLSEANIALTDQNKGEGAATLAQQLRKVLAFVIRYNTVFVFIVMVVVSTLLSDVFLTQRNVINLIRQVSGLGIICMGMLMVILTGGIDLSVGSLAALGSVLIAFFLQDADFGLALLLTIGAGFLMGSVSGILVSVWRMAPFVATLAMMTVGRGLSFVVSKGAPITARNDILDTFGTGNLGGIPYPIVLMFTIVIITLLVLRFTAFGRIIMAIGSNESAVRLAGIRVSYYKYAVYAISGTLCMLGGIISTARTGVGSPIVATGLELDAIAAVVIGGASLTGGRGNAINTLLGVLILGMIGNIMNLLNIPNYPQQILQGVIIVIAVLIQGVQIVRSR
ncbi:MAG: ABC transporter permease [Chloroflexi bacterium]|nr:ABC transporter permease [Chloroflexota bacterium]